jgi:hypothetical protein
LFWKTTGRVLIVIPFALLCSMLASLFVIATLGLERITSFLHVNPIDGDNADQIFGILDQGVMLVASTTVIPALLMVIAGEIARIRSLVYYVVGGGLALAAIPLLARFGPAAAVTEPQALVWQVFATAGFAGGFVYWLIAGRNA